MRRGGPCSPWRASSAGDGFSVSAALLRVDGQDHHQRAQRVGRVGDVDGEYLGCLKKEFSFFTPRFVFDCSDWEVEGSWTEWDYSITSPSQGLVAAIGKELFNWTDTYVIDVPDPSNALCALMVVLAGREEAEFLLQTAQVFPVGGQLKLRQKSQHALLDRADMPALGVHNVQAVPPAELALHGEQGPPRLIVDVIAVKPGYR